MPEVAKRKGYTSKVDPEKRGIQSGGSWQPEEEIKEELTPEQEIEKQVLVSLLKKWITPDLSGVGLKGRTPPDKLKAAFLKKIENQPLENLRKFFDIELSELLRSEIQKKYDDISP